jgi:2-polyprenyl-3-methyl-5-hydroxy-6-metoxy-1,4-benzoquinol methylase
MRNSAVDSRLNDQISSVLDVGCGSGGVLMKLSQDHGRKIGNGFTIYDGIDLSKNAIRIANQLYPKAAEHNVNLAPSYFRPDMKVYDVGGGKQPFVSVEKKAALGLIVVGIDISQSELDRAPVGAYDESVCGDVANVQGMGDGDLVICQAVLEHVKDIEGAMKSIASLLKPGGKALIFVPSRNAVFARLNILLPENIKRKILFSIYPSTSAAQGFPSFYNKCTPDDFVEMASKNGLVAEESRYYFISSYFSFLFPIYLLQRIWILLFKAFFGHQAAETFSMVLVKDNSTK